VVVEPSVVPTSVDADVSRKPTAGVDADVAGR
jgi:hypothetical protein